MSVASKGTNRGSRSGVRDADGIGVDRLQADKNTGGALTHDANVNTLLADIWDVMERIQQQLAVMNEGDNLAPGERHFT